MEKRFFVNSLACHHLLKIPNRLPSRVRKPAVRPPDVIEGEIQIMREKVGTFFRVINGNKKGKNKKNLKLNSELKMFFCK